MRNLRILGCSDRHSNWSPFDCTAQTLPDGRTVRVPRIGTESKKVKQSRYRPRGFQEVKVPRFRDSGTGW